MLPAMVPGCWKWAPALPKVAILLRKRARGQSLLSARGWLSLPCQQLLQCSPKAGGDPGASRTILAEATAPSCDGGTGWHVQSQAGQPWCLAVILTGACSPQLLLQPTR